MNKAVTVGIVVWLGVMAAGWWWYQQQRAPAPNQTVAEPSPAPAPEAQTETVPPVRYPVPQPERPPIDVDDGAPAPAPRPALPSLADSDAPLQKRLAQANGEPPFTALLSPKRLIEKAVISVHSLDRRTVPAKFRPLAAIPGRFVAETRGEQLLLGRANFARYEHAVAAFEALDTDALVATYLHFYPRFQQAFDTVSERRGAYFNDRLIQIIDHLLQAPSVDGPIRLKRPKVLYQFEDPALEALSPGQKAMLRIGPQNAERVKAKLREIRAALIAASG